MIRTLALTLLTLALTAPVASATEVPGHDGGHGLVGETNDLLVTNVGFAILAFFPLLILTLSLIQWRLDKRKEERKEAAKARQRREYERYGY